MRPGEGRDIIMNLNVSAKEFYGTSNPGVSATRTILIVDDSPVSITLTEMALSMIDKDIRTECVFTGEGALEILKKTSQLPAVILLDLKMPGMGGIETLKRIRSDEHLKALPVIIVTSSTLESDIQETGDAGATGFVYKAISLRDFRQDLERYINTDRQATV
jgi:CheY-like chemotaxis protein